MALDSAEKKKAKRKSKKRARAESDQQLERLNSLPWGSSLNGGGDDDFSLFIGSNELEGGFLTLEEIDESEYGLEIQNVGVKTERKKSKGKTKSSGSMVNKGSDDESSAGELYVESDGKDEETKEEDEKKEVKQKKKKKDKKKKKKDNQKNDEPNKAQETAQPASASDGRDDDKVEEESVDEEEYHAWNELRLHPMIMKSIYRLKFREPTPIQKACIPPAAHQGKDVIGAAETGSGKTLAFGLPILQRLLEEREKVERLMAEKGEASDRIAPQGVLRALIVTPTRELALQVTDHLKEVALGTNVRVVPIVGGMSTEKQERLLKARPEIVVGTPGRLWELMSGGEVHLVELQCLSFFVLDEADRMIEAGHFRELQSIIDMLPMNKESTESQPQNTQNCVTVASLPRKKRQTFVFSATLALSADFRKKLKRGSVRAEKDGLNSIETLSERAGMRANTAIVDLTNASILANKLVESMIECREDEKDAYLYYILSVHGQGRTIVFCTSIAALRRISALLRILSMNIWTLHSEMQQRARLKSIDRFRANEHGILVATDAAARGLDIPGVRTVIHYQLPLSAEVYVHRCGRTARAFTDGCSIALISPNDASKFAALCKSFSKESFQRFPVQISYMPEIMKRSSLAHQIDKIGHSSSATAIMAIITEEPDSPRPVQRKPKPKPKSEPTSPPSPRPSASTSTKPATTTATANPFPFWFYFTLIVSLITLLCVLLSSLSPQDPRTWFLNLPPILRHHYSNGRTIKVQTAPNHPQVEVFSIQQGPTNSDSRVLIVHGIGCSSFAFQDVVKFLGSRNVHTVAIDLPGSGFSDKSVVVVEESVGGIGFLGRIWDVYEEIKEKGLFWGFDQLVEQGYVNFEENKVRVSKKERTKAIELGSEEMGRVLRQVVDSMELAPVDLVLHDSALGLSANWISENQGLIRSVVVLDGAPSGTAVPLWVLEMPVVREVVLGFRFVFERVLAMCCMSSVGGPEAEAHRILLKGRDGASAVVGMGKKLNFSFDLSEWISLDGVKGLPIQVIWSGGWSDKWTSEGRQIADALLQAKFVTHSGGRWTQERNAEEVAESIYEFVSSLPKATRKVIEEMIPNHFRETPTEAKSNDQHHHHHHHSGHDHQNGHGHYDHGHSGYMDAYGLGHGWAM